MTIILLLCIIFSIHEELCQIVHLGGLMYAPPGNLTICDRIWENPPYGICARFAQCAFLVPKVEICQSPDFVIIYMSNNLSSNCCRCLQRLVVLYEGEISLHFDLPSSHNRCTRNPLLWALIRILYLDTARFIKLLYIRSPF